MESKRFTAPLQKNYELANQLAYRLVSERLARLDDIEQQCVNSGARCKAADSKQTVTISYLNQSYLIAFPDIEVSRADSAEKVPLRDKLLILHYFISAKGTPLAGKQITFRELPAGVVYFPTFSKRTVKPILDHFGQEPKRLIDVAAELGGHRVDYGNAAVTIDAFSRVAITIILWQGDAEFAAQGNVVFDANISDYLPTEDITVLCESIAWRLVRLLKSN
ncbi:DUF3786 domain-containing protein [Chloroflexota bacterium]